MENTNKPFAMIQISILRLAINIFTGKPVNRINGSSNGKKILPKKSKANRAKNSSFSFRVTLLNVVLCRIQQLFR